MKEIIFLIFGFLILIKGADFLVSGSSALAKRLKFSNLVIGLTVVAFGTSTPELFVNFFASLEGNAEIAIGNVVGSNIFNILVILGISSIIYPLSVTKGTLWKEIPFSLIAAILVGVMANDVLFDHAHYSVLSRIDGFILLLFFIIFMYYILTIAKDEHVQLEEVMQINLQRSLWLVAGGLVILVLGGKFIVENAVIVAGRLGISQSVIGLTIVAAGTSLPELVTSVVAAYRKNSDIAVGNIVGSNIFNIFFILGISSLIKPIQIVSQINPDIWVLIAVSLVLFVFMFTGKRRKLDRWEGIIFVLFYIGYIIFLLKRG